jgi:hypothetical protein
LCESRSIESISVLKKYSGLIVFFNRSKQEKGNQNYFETFEKITGIRKEKLNALVWKWIVVEK